ncbi:acylphosphatase [Furfurilactobacillus siliginis]|uniref:acylphosphatase n=1 Tax=Furfurilactobacillus siliginis TaxID=348151 RepID=A0A0R2KZV4_9LACO|nr:acylphosphatase [Furfurilactobacillus siliginis]KRN95081.1 hypothetical protein IV55_GL000362 [Furfurilactobacillus siliginis]GEK28338.1 acylphosphatase [Furfurilactobacillus siliginis]
MSQTAVSLIAHGRVQGVGFRYAVYQLAVRQHLVGTVHNNTDKTVSIFAQGDSTIVTTFIKQVRQSPNSWSHVTELEIHEAQVQPSLKTFDIS